MWCSGGTATKNICSKDEIRNIRAGTPKFKIIMLSANHDAAAMSRPYSAGATRFLVKSSVLMDLPAAIRLFVSGNKIFAKLANVLNFAERRSKQQELHTQFLRQSVPRDKRILIALAQSQINSEIDTLIHISEVTVKAKIAKLLEALHLYTRVQLAVLVVEAGLLAENKISSPLGPVTLHDSDPQV